MCLSQVGFAQQLTLTAPPDITVGGTRATYIVTLPNAESINRPIYLFASGTSGTFYDALTGGGTID
ncbi:MAG: hypothetical protein ACO3JI_10595, partial [Steroidobacteraceae bacterium]